jgi:hypothetical protein
MAVPGSPGLRAGATYSALQGAVQDTGKEIGSREDLKDRALAALIGAGTFGAVKGVGKALNKTGDAAMQIAVGRKKYTPGVGTELADSGVFGTRGMMAKQVAKKMAVSGQSLDDAAKSIPGTPVSGKAIGESILEKSTKNKLPKEGILTYPPSQADTADLNDIIDYADDVANRGNMSAMKARGYGKAAGERAFQGREVAGAGLQKKLAKLEQQETSQAIKAADPTGAYAKESSKYGAFARANKSLTEDPTLPRSLMGLLSQPVAALPGVSVVPSLVGQVGTKADKLSQFLRPAVVQGAVSGQPVRSQDSKDRDEYEQYLRETGQR